MTDPAPAAGGLVKKRRNTRWDDDPRPIIQHKIAIHCENQLDILKEEETYHREQVMLYNKVCEVKITEDGEYYLEGEFVEARTGTAIDLVRSATEIIAVKVDKCLYDGSKITTIRRDDGGAIKLATDYMLMWNFDYSHYKVLREALGRGISNPSKPLVSVLLGQQDYNMPAQSPSTTAEPPPPGEEVVNKLTEEQRATVEATFQQRVTLCDSGPGCGKTSTGGATARQHVEAKKNVALIAKTNSAVNELALRCKRVHGLPVVRIYSASVAEEMREDDLEDIAQRNGFDDIQILAATPVGFCKKALDNKIPRIDTVIFDEANCLLQPEVSAVLRFVEEHAVFVGDLKQGKPFALASKSKELGAEQSTFKCLQDSGFRVHTLSWQFRMHPDICKVPNQVLYQGRLKSGVTAEQKASPFTWPHSVPVKMLDIVAQEMRRDFTHSVYNPTEAVEVAREVIKLLDLGVPLHKITCLAMYRAQIDEISRFTRKNRRLAELNLCTVQSYQGKENDFIILSMVRSNIDDSAGICNDAQWISVALTRARLGFILLCDQEMFRNAGPVWKEALKSYTKLTQSAS